MALFRQKLKAQFSMENANPRVIEAEPGAAVARVNQLKKETDESMVEVARVAQEGELLTEEMEVLTDEYQGLDRVHETLESFRSEGGMNPQAAAILNAAMEGFRIRLGMTAAIPSTESFGSSTDRMAMTEISIESISEFAKKIWEAIKKAWNKMVDWVKGLFGKKKESAEKLKARFKELKDAKPEGKPGKEDGMEFSKTKSVFYTDKIIEGPEAAIKFITDNANFGLKVLEMNKKMAEAIKKTDAATTEAASAPAEANTQSTESYTVSMERGKGSKARQAAKKAANEKVAKNQQAATEAAAEVVKVAETAPGDKPSDAEPVLESSAGTTEIKSPYFFGGQYVVFSKANDGADFAAEVKKPDNYGDKEGKLAFSSNWSQITSSADVCYKYLDEYTASKAAEDCTSAMEKLTGKNIETDNSEAQNFIRTVMSSYQKLIADVLGKVDTAVLSGMSLAADYYEATKESYKKD